MWLGIRPGHWNSYSSLSRRVTDPLITPSGPGPLFSVYPIKKTTCFVTHLPNVSLSYKSY